MAPCRHILFGGGGLREEGLALLGEGRQHFQHTQRWVWGFFSFHFFFRTPKKKNVGLFCFLPAFVCETKTSKVHSVNCRALGTGASSRLCIPFNEILLPLTPRFLNVPPRFACAHTELLRRHVPLRKAG